MWKRTRTLSVYAVYLLIGLFYNFSSRFLSPRSMHVLGLTAAYLSSLPIQGKASVLIIYLQFFCINPWM